MTPDLWWKRFHIHISRVIFIISMMLVNFMDRVLVQKVIRKKLRYSEMMGGKLHSALNDY